jgi:hypothetical protein
LSASKPIRKREPYVVPKGDLMLGGGVIAAYVRKLFGDPKLSDPTVYRWIARGFIPVNRTPGGRISGSKRLIREALTRPTSGPGPALSAAPEAPQPLAADAGSSEK